MGWDQARPGRNDAGPLLSFWGDEGWVSLGRARNYERMHMQAAQA